MATKKPSTAQRSKAGAVSPTKKAAAAAGAAQPADYYAKVRAHVPDFVYATTFGDVSLPAYMPTAIIMDNPEMSEGEMFTALISDATDQESKDIIRALPPQDFEGIEGSLESLMTAWFNHQGIDMGESQASSE